MDRRLAQEIGAYCANCKKSLAHTVTAVDNGTVLTVVCGSCKEEHPFIRPIAPKATPKKRNGKKAKPKNAQQISDNWKAEMARLRDLSATVYTMGGEYSEGEKLDHNTFGMGLIQKLIAPDKMEVSFESGQKLLVRGSSHSG